MKTEVRLFGKTAAETRYYACLAQIVQRDMIAVVKCLTFENLPLTSKRKVSRSGRYMVIVVHTV